MVAVSEITFGFSQRHRRVIYARQTTSVSRSRLFLCGIVIASFCSFETTQELEFRIFVSPHLIEKKIFSSARGEFSEEFIELR